MGQEGLIKKLSMNLKTGINTLWKAFSSRAEESPLGKPIRHTNLIQINSVPEIVLVSPEKLDDMGRRCEDGLLFSPAIPKNLLSTFLEEAYFNESELKLRWKKEPMPTEMINVNTLQKTQKDTPGWERLREIVLIQTLGEEGQIGKFSRLLGSRVNALWEAILSQAGVTYLKKTTVEMNLLRGNASELMLISPEALLDEIEKSEDRMPPCPLDPEGWPTCSKLKECLRGMEQEFWSDIDANWYYEKFPWKKECCDRKMDSFVDRNDDPTANGLL